MDSKRFIIVHRRDNIFKSAAKGWSRPDFLGSLKLIEVKFISDESSLEEDAEDLGGPRREFFRLLKTSIIKHSSVFQGLLLDTKLFPFFPIVKNVATLF